MTTSQWLLSSIILWLLQKSNAGPVMLNKNDIHYTKVGDISPKDILHMVDEATPADKRILSPDQMEYTAEANIEAERNQYYQNDHPDLDSPNDQERKFVHLLKKHYKGTFPEYDKETQADYARNSELDENLNAQPETVFFGHSDMYHGKNGGNEDIGDIQDADVDPSMDNLDTFDSDANLLNTFSTGRFHAKINNPTAAPFRTTARHHSENHPIDNNKEIENELYAENDYLSDGDDDDASGTTGVEDEHLSTNEEQEDAYKGTQKAQKTEDQMQEKTEEDTEESTPQKVLHDHGKKTKNTKENNKKNKSNKDGGSKAILDEFDDLKGHHKNTHQGHAGIEDDGKQIAGTMSKNPSPKHQPENKSGKNINYIHAEDSQGTSDAILDFLDKLLEKDPKKLRHDVLTMAKAMKNEETMQTGRVYSSVNGNQDSNPSKSENTKMKHRIKDENGSLRKKIDESKEVEKWISTLEDKKGAEKETDAAISQSENGYSFDDEEYNEYHESPDVYPDHNPGGETTSSESVYDGLGEGEKNDGKENDKAEEVKEKEQEFDYQEFKEEALKMHNEFRGRHNAAVLQWSEELAKKAHDIAEQLTSATRNSFKRELEKHGQSIAILPYLTKHIAKSAVQKWYSEITKFSFASPEVKPETRDFTQIIWSGSKRLGMGFAYSANKKKTLVVALYNPAGNSRKEMRKNLNIVNYDLYADIRKAAIGRHG